MGFLETIYNVGNGMFPEKKGFKLNNEAINKINLAKWFYYKEYNYELYLEAREEANALIYQLEQYIRIYGIKNKNLNEAVGAKMELLPPRDLNKEKTEVITVFAKCIIRWVAIIAATLGLLTWWIPGLWYFLATAAGQLSAVSFKLIVSLVFCGFLFGKFKRRK